MIRAHIVNGRLLLSGGGVMLSSSAGASPSSLTLRDFVTFKAGVRPVVQRKAGLLTADVPVLYDYTGATPSNIEARVVAYSGGAEVLTWTRLQSESFAGGIGLGTLPGVPQGADYLIQVRDGLNHDMYSNGAVPWGVGVNILCMGQSNMVGTLNSGSYTDTVPGTASTEYDYFNAGSVAGAVFDDAGFHAPSNGTNGPTGSMNTAIGGILALMRIVSVALTAKYGKTIPVAVIPWAFGATSIAQYFPAGSQYSVILNGSGSTAGTVGFASPRNVFAGDFEGCIWHQGEANNGDSTASYLADLKTLYAGLISTVAPHGRTATNLFFLPAVLGVYASMSHIENIRAAVLELDTFARANYWPKVRAGWSCIDLDAIANDGLHFVGAYARTSLSRAIQSILYQLGCTTFSGLGPKLSSVSRTGDVATITVAHDGGVAITTPAGGSPSGFAANTAADFSGSAISVTAAIVSGSVQVTFPVGTSYPCYLKYMGGQVGTAGSRAPDITNPIYDNTNYPTGVIGTDIQALGLPLLPTPTALVVS